MSDWNVFDDPRFRWWLHFYGGRALIVAWHYRSVAIPNSHQSSP